MRPGAQVFLHIPDKNKFDRISKLCEKCGYSCCQIQNADVNRTILELISGQSAGKKVSAPPLYFLPEMMIFQGLADKEVHRFLEMYRAEGLPTVDLNTGACTEAGAGRKKAAVHLRGRKQRQRGRSTG